MCWTRSIRSGSNEPVPPSQLVPKIPRDAETICLKCLEKDPARRYADVAALADDLHRFQAGEPIRARAISGIERVWRWCLRNQRVAALIGLVICCHGGFSRGAQQQEPGSRPANIALGKANTTAKDKQIEAELKQKLAEEAQKRAVAAARAANQQNRAVAAAQRDLIGLLDEKLRYLPELQDVRGDTLAKAKISLEAAIQAMTELRREVEWDPKDEELNWRTLAGAQQRLGELALSQNRIDEGVAHLRELNAIADRLLRGRPGRPRCANAADPRHAASSATPCCIIWATTTQPGRISTKPRSSAGPCWRTTPKTTHIRSSWPTRWASSPMRTLMLGHLEDARKRYLEELDLRNALSPNTRKAIRYRRELAGLYEKLGELNLRMGNIAEARRAYEICENVRKENAAETPGFWPTDIRPGALAQQRREDPLDP